MYKILTGFPKYMEYIESCKKKKSRKYVTIIHHPEIIGCQTQNKKTKQIQTMIYFTPVGELSMQP